MAINYLIAHVRDLTWSEKLSARRNCNCRYWVRMSTKKHLLIVLWIQIFFQPITNIPTVATPSAKLIKCKLLVQVLLVHRCPEGCEIPSRCVITSQRKTMITRWKSIKSYVNFRKTKTICYGQNFFRGFCWRSDFVQFLKIIKSLVKIGTYKNVHPELKLQLREQFISWA